jgi:hypothetical protein
MFSGLGCRRRTMPSRARWRRCAPRSTWAASSGGCRPARPTVCGASAACQLVSGLGQHVLCTLNSSATCSEYLLGLCCASYRVRTGMRWSVAEVHQALACVQLHRED